MKTCAVSGRCDGPIPRPEESDCARAYVPLGMISHLKGLDRKGPAKKEKERHNAVF